jgi:hypothetical protein
MQMGLYITTKRTKGLIDLTQSLAVILLYLDIQWIWNGENVKLSLSSTWLPRKYYGTWKNLHISVKVSMQMGLYILIIHIQALNLLQYSCTRYLHNRNIFGVIKLMIKTVWHFHHFNQNLHSIWIATDIKKNKTSLLYQGTW